MTTINPELLFEILKQKINWGYLLTPVRRIAPYIESFNTTTGKSLIIDGSKLVGLELTNECKDKTEEKDKFQSMDLTPTTKTVVAVLTDVCLIKQVDDTVVRVKMDLSGFDKSMMDLIPKGGTDKDILTDLKSAPTKVTKYATFSLGKNTITPEKKDILGLLFALIKQEYSKSSVKDGELKQTILNEHSIITSDKQNYVHVIDATIANAMADPKLCDITTNAITFVNINTYRMLDEGKSFCVDLDYRRYYQQQKTLNINLRPPEPTPTPPAPEPKTQRINGRAKPKVQAPPPPKPSDDTKKPDPPVPLDDDEIKPKPPTPSDDTKKPDTKGKEMMETGKKTVLDSFIANYLKQVYSDNKKWNVEWMRDGDNIIYLKATNLQNNERVFYKFDISNAVSDTSKCPEKSSVPVIREFLYIEKFCKRNNQYKILYNLVGSEDISMSGNVVPFATLKETKSSKELQDFIESLGEKMKDMTDNTKKVGFYPWPWTQNLFRGLYGIGYGTGCPGCGCEYGSVVGYPFYGCGFPFPFPYPGVINSANSTVVVPKMSLSITPSAPITISGYGKSCGSQSYEYPAISRQNIGYSKVYYPNSIQSNQPIYSESLVRNNFSAPNKSSSLKELERILNDNSKYVNIERVSSQLYKVQFEANQMIESHIYAFDMDGIYHVKHEEKRLF